MNPVLIRSVGIVENRTHLRADLARRVLSGWSPWGEVSHDDDFAFVVGEAGVADSGIGKSFKRDDFGGRPNLERHGLGCQR